MPSTCRRSRRRPTRSPVAEGPDHPVSAQSRPQRQDVPAQPRSRTGPRLHQRFTEWIYPIVFALIALAVAGDARSHREARINPLITAIAICAVRALAGLLRRPARRETMPHCSPTWSMPCRSSPPLVAIWFIAHQPDHGTAGRLGRLGMSNLAAASATGWSALKAASRPARPLRAREPADGLDARPLFLLPLRDDHDLVLPRPLRAGFPDRFHRVLQPHHRPARLHLSDRRLRFRRFACR